MESRTIISMKIVAPGQMSHGDKGLTGWRLAENASNSRARVLRVNPKIHYCGADCRRADPFQAGETAGINGPAPGFTRGPRTLSIVDKQI